MLTLRKTVSEQFGFYLICTVIVTTALIDHEKSVTNIYRVGVCLPILLCLRGLDIKAFISMPFVQLFLTLTLWSTLTLFWSDAGSIKNMATKLLCATVFLYAVFLMRRYQCEKARYLEGLFVAAGCALSIAVLIKFDASSMIYSLFATSGYGAFGNINEMAWFVSGALLVALFHGVHPGGETGKKAKTLAILAVPLLCYMLSQTKSLAAALSVVAGVLFFMVSALKAPYHKWLYGVLVLLLTVAVAGHYSYSDALFTFYQQLDRSRVEIYQSAYQAITSSWQTVVFGEGLASSARNTLSNGELMNNWHSIYINTVFYTGIVGLVLFLACVGYRLKQVMSRQKPLCSWDLVVVGSLTAFLFDGNRFHNYPGGIFISLMLPLFLANITQGKNIMR
ncbi:O-antigen ligase family protein [Candidatus Sororendozoicomonas aggregata]|uniref:O-antigen ligase family protein n=1 Tax=Candidatus Sororendozoicomonas aggregata TaxID=3073239 RepID=UPI002ED48348